MHPVDTLQIRFDEGQMVFLNFAMAFIMFSIALDIRLADFRKVAQFPKSILAGLIAQYLLFPIFTLLLIFIFKPATSIALGMVLVSACPSGNVTNFLVHHARANVALSITFNAIVIMGATVLTPALFALYAPYVPDSETLRNGFELPFADMAKIIVTLILIPLLLGMFLNEKLPKLTDKLRKPAQNLSLLIFFGILIGALWNNRDHVVNYLGYVFLIVALLNVGALAGGYFFGKLWKLPEADARTLSFETGIHNTALGLVLIFNFFGGLGGMALIAAWYGIWDLVTGFGLAAYWRKYSGLE